MVLGKGRRMKSALQVMMGLEARSNHPYALSIVDHWAGRRHQGGEHQESERHRRRCRWKHGTAEVAFIRPDKAEAMGLDVEDRLLRGVRDGQELRVMAQACW